MTATQEQVPVRRDVQSRFDEWLAQVKRTATGVGFRTKILGIILVLTTLLGLVVTWQVRSAMTGVLKGELDNRGRSVASDLAARTTTPILLSDTYAVFELLNDTVQNHPDAAYAFVVDPAGSVVAHTFGEEGFPVGVREVNRGTDPATGGFALFDSNLGRIHDFRAPILESSMRPSCHDHGD